MPILHNESQIRYKIKETLNLYYQTTSIFYKTNN